MPIAAWGSSSSSLWCYWDFKVFQEQLEEHWGTCPAETVELYSWCATQLGSSSSFFPEGCWIHPCVTSNAMATCLSGMQNLLPSFYSQEAFWAAPDSRMLMNLWLSHGRETEELWSDHPVYRFRHISVVIIWFPVQQSSQRCLIVSLWEIYANQENIKGSASLLLYLNVVHFSIDKFVLSKHWYRSPTLSTCL